ncbi:unnamed protein product [Bursaphelenchus okinawaensis]|uniref:Uncharacterized protein n=1 Tax=Bursaphelenchus okinawaensis TaxID=465554 RepID=A0A811LU37_9BILA|nr:unnamed protein product [Bursaphelenchus okinawaensis]CAG9127830.1 unnamed protein product [Bursaphelenchus okinawaensis]
MKKALSVFSLWFLLVLDVNCYHFRKLYPELTTLLQSDVSGNADGLNRAQRKLLLVLVNNDEGEEDHFFEAIRDHKVAKRFVDVFETALAESNLSESMRKYLLEIQKSLHTLYSVSKSPTNIDRQLVHSALSNIWNKYDKLSSNEKGLIIKKAPEFLDLNTNGDEWLAKRRPVQIMNQPHSFNSGSSLYCNIIVVLVSMVLFLM